MYFVSNFGRDASVYLSSLSYRWGNFLNIPDYDWFEGLFNFCWLCYPYGWKTTGNAGNSYY